MRLTRLSATLIVWVVTALAAAAFEIEERVVYPGRDGARVLRIGSTADRAVFEPILLGFQAENPDITLDYTIASTTELMAAVTGGEGDFDLVISSAMDLQTKLANDGFAQIYRSDATARLPVWAVWRDQLFAFTQEPGVLIVSDRAFPPQSTPTTRADLIEAIRDDPDRFRGKIGTYDVRRSGFGYLMATQDARVSETSWRLFEAMGRLNTRLYTSSGDMIRAIRSGEVDIAYNVLGSYASSELAKTKDFRIVQMEDFANVMLRTAIILDTASNPQEAGTLVDFLIGLSDRPDLVAASGLPAIDENALKEQGSLRPIRLGPGLLVFLDRLKRESFLRSWEASITQN